MAFESRTGLGTVSQYGPRETGATAGVERSTDSHHQLSFELTTSGLIDKYLPPYVMPKGAKITKATISVDAVPTGVTALSVGEGNAAATNGLSLVTGDLALGTRDVTAKLTGTWAANAQLTKASQLQLLVTGTPTPQNARVSIVIDYLYKRRLDTEWAKDPTTAPTGYRPQFTG